MQRVLSHHPEAAAWVQVFLNLRVAFAVLHESVASARRLNGAALLSLASAPPLAPLPQPPAPTPSDAPSRRAIAQAVQDALATGTPSLAESLVATVLGGGGGPGGSTSSGSSSGIAGGSSSSSSASGGLSGEQRGVFAATMTRLRAEATAMAYTTLHVLHAPQAELNALLLAPTTTDTAAATVSSGGAGGIEIDGVRARTASAPPSTSARPPRKPQQTKGAPDPDYPIPAPLRNYLLDAERLLRSEGLLMARLPPYLRGGTADAATASSSSSSSAVPAVGGDADANISTSTSASSPPTSTGTAAATGSARGTVVSLSSAKLQALLRSRTKQLGALRRGLFLRPLTPSASRNALLAPLLASFLGDREELRRQLAATTTTLEATVKANLARLVLEGEALAYAPTATATALKVTGSGGGGSSSSPPPHAAKGTTKSAPPFAPAPPSSPSTLTAAEAALIKAATYAAREWTRGGGSKLAPPPASRTSSSSPPQQQQQAAAPGRGSSTPLGSGIVTAWTRLPAALSLPHPLVEALVSESFRHEASVLQRKALSPAVVGYFERGLDGHSSTHSTVSGQPPTAAGAAKGAAGSAAPTAASDAATPAVKSRGGAGGTAAAAAAAADGSVSSTLPSGLTGPTPRVVVAHLFLQACGIPMALPAAATTTPAAVASPIVKSQTQPGAASAPGKSAPFAGVVVPVASAAPTRPALPPPPSQPQPLRPATLGGGDAAAAAAATSSMTQRRAKARKLLATLNTVCTPEQKAAIRVAVGRLAEVRTERRVVMTATATAAAATAVATASLVLPSLSPSSSTALQGGASSSAPPSVPPSLPSSVAASAASSGVEVDVFREPMARALVAVVLRHLPLRHRHTLYSSVFRNFGAVTLRDFDELVTHCGSESSSSGADTNHHGVAVGDGGGAIGGASGATEMESPATPVAASAEAFARRLSSLLNDADFLKLRSVVAEHTAAVDAWVVEASAAAALSLPVGGEGTSSLPRAPSAPGRPTQPLTSTTAKLAARYESTLRSGHLIFGPLLAPELDEEFAAVMAPPSPAHLQQVLAQARAQHAAAQPLGVEEGLAARPPPVQLHAALRSQLGPLLTASLLDEARLAALLDDAQAALEEEERLEAKEEAELAAAAGYGAVAEHEVDTQVARLLQQQQQQQHEAAAGGLTSSGGGGNEDVSGALRNAAGGVSGGGGSGGASANDDGSTGGTPQYSPLVALRRRLELARSPFIPAELVAETLAGADASSQPPLHASGAGTTVAGGSNNPMGAVAGATGSGSGGERVFSATRLFSPDAVRILAAQWAASNAARHAAAGPPTASSAPAAAEVTAAAAGAAGTAAATVSVVDQGIPTAAASPFSAARPTADSVAFRGGDGEVPRIQVPQGALAVKLQKILGVQSGGAAAAATSAATLLTTGSISSTTRSETGGASIATAAEGGTVSRGTGGRGLAGPWADFSTALPSILVPLRLTIPRRTSVPTASHPPTTQPTAPTAASSTSSSSSGAISVSSLECGPAVAGADDGGGSGGEAEQQQQQEEEGRKVMLWNLPPSATPASVAAALSRCGTVAHVEMWRERWALNEARAVEAERATQAKSQWQRRRKAGQQQQQRLAEQQQGQGQGEPLVAPTSSASSPSMTGSRDRRNSSAAAASSPPQSTSTIPATSAATATSSSSSVAEYARLAGLGGAGGVGGSRSSVRFYSTRSAPPERTHTASHAGSGGASGSKATPRKGAAAAAPAGPAAASTTRSTTSRAPPLPSPTPSSKRGGGAITAPAEEPMFPKRGRPVVPSSRRAAAAAAAAASHASATAAAAAAGGSGPRKAGKGAG